MPTITLAHSPDSDDAFMFYALADGKIDTGDRQYVHELQDIETLNQRALRGELDVTAVSIHAYAYLADRYALLSHGASIGNRYGPCLVSRDEPPREIHEAVRGKRIAIPGHRTTAALALRLFQPECTPVVVPFDQIEEHVHKGTVDAGLLIHEGQLTYESSGLRLWLDMGEWWFAETGLPLPLGGNAIRRDLGDDAIRAVSRDLRASIVYALDHRDAALDHAMGYARGLDRVQTDAFVGMYVNDFTLDYGAVGRRAVQTLLDRAADREIIPARVAVEFIDD